MNCFEKIINNLLHKSMIWLVAKNCAPRRFGVSKDSFAYSVCGGLPQVCDTCTGTRLVQPFLEYSSKKTRPLENWSNCCLLLDCFDLSNCFDCWTSLTMDQFPLDQLLDQFSNGRVLLDEYSANRVPANDLALDFSSN